MKIFFACGEPESVESAVIGDEFGAVRLLTPVAPGGFLEHDDADASERGRCGGEP